MLDIEPERPSALGFAPPSAPSVEITGEVQALAIHAVTLHANHPTVFERCMGNPFAGPHWREVRGTLQKRDDGSPAHATVRATICVATGMARHTS